MRKLVTVLALVGLSVFALMSCENDDMEYIETKEEFELSVKVDTQDDVLLYNGKTYPVDESYQSNDTIQSFVNSDYEIEVYSRGFNIISIETTDLIEGYSVVNDSTVVLDTPNLFTYLQLYEAYKFKVVLQE